MPEKEIIPVTNDVMFKALFVKCPEALAGFLASALKIERSTIKNVRIKNPELTPSCYEGKLTRLDILLELYDDVINIEMQVSKTADYKDRSLFYWARVYNDALKEGQSYNESKKCICINILNFTMFEEWKEYHSSFSVREDTHNVRLTDKLEIHFLELTKVKKITRDQNEVDSLKLWMQLFKAKSKEELDMLSNTTVDDIRTSVSVIYDLSEDEKLREYIRQREKAEFDYQSDMANAMAEGEKKKEAALIAKWKAKGMTDEEIKELLG
ncbi:MAG: Rpn family recombination-promoting nuclease/putative transposase [Oscillospiraceae bacterium]|nr:Rpn family recombination-promoting nuclease/putative transposase [Oscillospiraceae bacterium]MDO5147992.1 Rpn family recombination-promoting nuclease/putative transposase [Oscillospiraceae bacterium]